MQPTVPGELVSTSDFEGFEIIFCLRYASEAQWDYWQFNAILQILYDVYFLFFICS